MPLASHPYYLLVHSIYIARQVSNEEQGYILVLNLREAEDLTIDGALEVTLGVILLESIRNVSLHLHFRLGENVSSH